MPRAVVVAYHYPPDSAVGSRRWAGLTRQLASLGWEVWIVTPSTGEAPCPGIMVTTVERRRTLRDMYREWRLQNDETMSPSPAALHSGPRSAFSVPAFADRIRVEASAMIAYPDDARGWILRAARATHRLVRRVKPHLVVSSGPPHSCHVVGWLGTRGTDVPHVIDLRDPWAGPVAEAWDRGARGSRLGPLLDGVTERLVLRASGRILCTNAALQQELEKCYPGTTIAVVPNGVDRRDLATFHSAPGDCSSISLVHAGTIYGARSVTPLLKAMLMLRDRGIHCRLKLIGTIETWFRDQLRREVAQMRLGAEVDILGSLPRGRTQEFIAQSNIAVVLAQGQRYQVPAKLYECMALANSTIVLTESNSASWQEAGRVGAISVDVANIEAIAAAIDAAAVKIPRSMHHPPVFFEDVMDSFHTAMRRFNLWPTTHAHVAV